MTSRLEDIYNIIKSRCCSKFFLKNIFQLVAVVHIHFYSTRSFHFPQNPTTKHNNIIIIVSEHFRVHRCSEESHLIRGNRFNGSSIVQQ